MRSVALAAILATSYEVPDPGPPAISIVAKVGLTPFAIALDAIDFVIETSPPLRRLEAFLPDRDRDKPDLAFPPRLQTKPLRPISGQVAHLARSALLVLVGPPGFEPGISCSQSRRVTRLRHGPAHRTAGR